MAAQYLTPEQDEKIRQWERWNRNYFIFAFVALTIILVFSSQWGPLGVLIAALITPIIVLQLKLACPACGQKIGWQAKLMAPDQCKTCGTFLRSRD